MQFTIATCCHGRISHILPKAGLTKTLRIMKLIIILLTAFCLQVSARGYSQVITLNLKNAPLEKVFAEIEKQTGFNFFYENGLLKAAKSVSINITKASIDQVLNFCFREQPFEYKIVQNTVFIKRKELPKFDIRDDLGLLPINIEGKVTDIKGNALSGATIKVKGNDKTILTDVNGTFSIKDINEEDILEISFIGFETKTIRIGKDNIFLNVILHLSPAVLTEINITTALGIERKKRELGYSIDKVSGEDLRKTSPTNLMTGLVGKVSGLTIATVNTDIGQNNIRINLRGVRSITGNNTPLFVLDGMPLTGENGTPLQIVNSINPEDVEDITILKGANSSALYGPEGVNGVVIISTKKGKGKPQISFNHATIFQKIDKRYPKYQKEFGGGSTIDQFGKGIYNPVDNLSWGPAFDGQVVTIGRPDENGEVQEVPYSYTDERLRFFKTGSSIQNDISLSGGDLTTNYFLSLNNTIITGIIPKDKSNRTTIRLNAGKSYKIFNTAFNLTYAKSNSDISNNTGGIDNAIINTPAHIPISQYQNYLTDKWSDRNHYFSDQSLNPYELLGYKRNDIDEQSFLGSLEIKVSPLRWLTIVNRSGINYYNKLSTTTTDALIFSDFAKQNGANGRTVSVSDVRSALSDASTVSTTLNNDLLITLTKTVGKFDLKAMVGSVVREYKSMLVTMSNNSLVIPNLFNYNNGSGTTTVSKTDVKTRLGSFLGTANIGYNNIVYFEFTIRRDYNSKISLGSDETFYSGINTSIIASDLFPSIKGKLISYLKFNAAYNKTANANRTAYLTEARFFSPTGFPFGSLTGFNFFAAGQPNVRPEKVLSQEYGFDLRVFNNKLNLSLNYYHQKNDDQILNVSSSSFSGASSVAMNAGSFYNKGWELDLNYISKSGRKSGLSYEIGLNGTINDSKVVSLFQGLDQIAIGQNRAIVGYPVYMLYANDWLKDSLGRIIVDRVTGLPSVDPNPKILGRNMPKYILGIKGGLTFKRISVNALIEYRGGHDYIHGLGSALDQAGAGKTSALNNRDKFIMPNSVYYDGGKYVENTDVVINNPINFLRNTFPLVGTNYFTSADFWKLREVVVAYEINIKNKFFNSLLLSLIGRNLFAIYPKSNIWGDPEQSSLLSSQLDNNIGQTGISSTNNLYSTRNYGFTIKMTF